MYSGNMEKLSYSYSLYLIILLCVPCLKAFTFLKVNLCINKRKDYQHVLYMCFIFKWQTQA